MGIDFNMTASDDRPFDIHVGYKSVRYSEAAGEMLFSREPSFKSLPSILWLPSPERWAISAPEWAKGRRDEIIARLKAATPADQYSQTDL
jgi:hypothetical protein